MASTPSSRLRLTPSNSPYLPRLGRSPHRGRASQDPRLTLKRVIGTTCTSPTGFDTSQSSFAYIAGGAVVVVDVDGEDYTQRFFRARPTAVPVYSTTNLPYSPSTPTTTPKANDSRGRSSAALRESSYGVGDWAESPSSRTWTSRERIKAATCLGLSPEGRFLAVGETGYAPRVLIFSLEDSSSDRPLVSISEHLYGVKAVSWSPDTKFLASLGAANDGFLYIWRIDSKTGAAKLYQQNRCTSFVRGMIWMGTSLITLGVRHVKLWRVEDGQVPSPTKQKFGGDVNSPSQSQKSLPGRNILLGGLIEATFSCAATIDETRAIICSETGDICLLDDTGKQMKLTKVLDSGFITTCVTVRDRIAYIGSAAGSFMTLDLNLFVDGNPDCILNRSESSTGIITLGFLKSNLVTIDYKHSIDLWNDSYVPGLKDTSNSRVQIPGQGDAILGVDGLNLPSSSEAVFYTWSGLGNITLWDMKGKMKESFCIAPEEAYLENESDPANQLTAVKATNDAKFFVTGDKLGILKVMEYATKKCVLETKAHASHCQYITTYEDGNRLLMASCGRDRTVQLFHKTSSGSFSHFQTLEFAAKVVQVLIPSSDRIITCSLDRTLQVYEVLTKENDPDRIAAFPLRSLSLRASPASIAVAPDMKSIVVSLLDRSVCVYDVEAGKVSNTFKCTDAAGVESVVLDSLTYRAAADRELAFLLGLSNTDKSIRIYDANTGGFLDREWGHTEAINGVALIQGAGGDKKVVSVGSDGTIMIWDIDLQEQISGSASRDPSPVKEDSPAVRAPLRRVLSKAELAEFQRPSSATSTGGRRSPPRTLTKRRSLYNLNSSISRTPIPIIQSSPPSITEDTPSRRPSSSSRTGSPPVSPKSRVTRRPSLPALKKTQSSTNIRSAFGSLNMATEQACRTLRAYRKKLSSTEPINHEVFSELDRELKLTSLALGDRALKNKDLSDDMLNDLLDQYSARLISMLDEKLRLSSPSPLPEDQMSVEDRPVSPRDCSSTSTVSSE
ncbi:WD40-repeat-containing domain protein [Xylariales sp. PMI_506]|nr:WD40-repeat-containing domain protein [Xylariales sp. PMI_506]